MKQDNEKGKWQTSEGNYKPHYNYFQDYIEASKDFNKIVHPLLEKKKRFNRVISIILFLALGYVIAEFILKPLFYP